MIPDHPNANSLVGRAEVGTWKNSFFYILSTKSILTWQSGFIQTLNYVTVIKCLAVDLSTCFLLANLQKFNNSIEWKIELQILRNNSTDGESPLFIINRKGNLEDYSES